jgi:hypothetical protein
LGERSLPVQGFGAKRRKNFFPLSSVVNGFAFFCGQLALRLRRALAWAFGGLNWW